MSDWRVCRRSTSARHVSAALCSSRLGRAGGSGRRLAAMATERRPVNVAEYAERARELLPQMVYDYYAGGAEDERTIADNRAAFGRWVLRPRVLVDVSERDLSTTVLGQPVPFPILVA